jgi:hypothetical protein
MQVLERFNKFAISSREFGQLTRPTIVLTDNPTEMLWYYWTAGLTMNA